MQSLVIEATPASRSRVGWVAAVVTLAASLSVGMASGAVAASSVPATVAGGALAALPGHVHRFAQPRFDRGEAPESLRMTGLRLVIARTPMQSAALEQLLADQQNPKSSQYHRWLTPAQYGARFGATDATIAALSRWLESQGLTVGRVPAGRGHLPFSGTKAQVEAAFHTAIHLFAVGSELHYANLSDPMVPTALQPLIVAIRGLDDVHPEAGAQRAPRPNTYYAGSNQYPGYVGPTDFATMYNLEPLYAKGVTGAGVTVAVAAQSNLNPSTLTTFWSAFGVSGAQFGLPAQRVTPVAVPSSDGGSSPPSKCNPVRLTAETCDGNEDEAYLDTEIVGGLAPGATIVLVYDLDATTAAQYVVDQNLAAVLNVSFSTCESDAGAGNAFIKQMWQQAASESITVTVSSADAGSATCTASADVDTPNDVNTNGFAVNAIASTPYDLAVGGTDFNPILEQQNQSLYWSTSNQSGTLASAISHIPEMVWNGSCANPVYASAYNTDSIAFCNSSDLPGVTPATANPFLLVSGEGAGLSSCITTNSAGDCTGGYPQPSWQQTLMSLGARSVPDVTMIATRWLVCSWQQSPCDPTQAPTFQSNSPIAVLQGTSAAAPSVAAIVALLDQTQITPSSTDGRQGLVNTLFYQLAGNQYTSGAQCDASQGAITASACAFYDITSGSNAQPCKVSSYAANAATSAPSSTCGTDTGDATGVMQIGGTQSYLAAVGFDVATGLGSINAAGLIGLVQGTSAPTGVQAVASGQSVVLTWQPFANATSYEIYQGTGAGTVSSTPVRSNVTGTSTTIGGLQFGQRYAFAVAAVTASGVSSMSAAVSALTVPAAPTHVVVVGAGAGALNLTWTASNGASSYQVSYANAAASASPIGETTVMAPSASITGLPSGTQISFQIVAVDAGGSSAAAQATGTVVPAAPNALSASAGNGSVTLSWSAPAGAASYDVYEGSATLAESAAPVETGVTGSSTTITGLGNGKKYFFYITAINSGGASTDSNEASATPAAPSGGGGGGSLDGVVIAVLALLAAVRAARSRDGG